MMEVKSIDSSRVLIQIEEDKDGLILLRKGAEGLELPGVWASVCIAMDSGKYIRGMAIYGQDKDFPDSVDIIFYTNPPYTKYPRDMSSNDQHPFACDIKRTNGGYLNIISDASDKLNWPTPSIAPVSVSIKSLEELANWYEKKAEALRKEARKHEKEKKSLETAES